MGNHDEIRYHRKRAAHELDLGLACDSLAAARSHLRLSSLHLERAMQLQGTTTPAAPSERPLFAIG